MSVIDLDYYTWRERSVDANGDERLIVPWSDPRQYEDDYGFIYPSAQAAIDSKERDDEARNERWVLVHYTGEVVIDQGESE